MIFQDNEVHNRDDEDETDYWAHKYPKNFSSSQAIIVWIGTKLGPFMLLVCVDFSWKIILAKELFVQVKSARITRTKVSLWRLWHILRNTEVPIITKTSIGCKAGICRWLKLRAL